MFFFNLYKHSMTDNDLNGRQEKLKPEKTQQKISLFTNTYSK